MALRAKQKRLAVREERFALTLLASSSELTANRQPLTASIYVSAPRRSEMARPVRRLHRPARAHGPARLAHDLVLRLRSDGGLAARRQSRAAVRAAPVPARGASPDRACRRGDRDDRRPER